MDFLLNFMNVCVNSIEEDPWLVVQTLAIFISICISAYLIGRQLRKTNQVSTIQRFMNIHDVLSREDLFELRRHLYRIGGKIQELDIIIDQISKYKKWDKDSKINNLLIEKFNLKSENILNKSKDDIIDLLEKRKDIRKYELFEFIKNKENKSRIDEIILTFDMMGITINHGGLLKKIMLDMYWDVIIKCCDCLKYYIYAAKMNKYEYASFFKKKNGIEKYIQKKPVSQCNPPESCKKCKNKQITLALRVKFGIVKAHRLIRILLKVPVYGIPQKRNYCFFTLRFYPSDCYPSTHVENFEKLKDHAEEYAWCRGLSRPLLCQ